MKKILVIFGTRPEIIKLAPVIKALKKSNTNFLVSSCATGQHESMVKIMSDIFCLIPDYNLGIMQKNQSLFDVTSNILQKIKNLLEDIKPDMVIVQGDTTTSFCGALSAFYLKIPVAHVEAGLRSFKQYEPYPEEINRRLISNLSVLHFAPTQRAKMNLLREGIDKNAIMVTGNTVIDALFDIRSKINGKYSPELKDIDFNNKIILATVHRRETFGDPLKQIIKSFKQIVTKNKNVAIVYPVHLNPNVKKVVEKELNNVKNIYLINPLDYLTFMNLMEKSHIILTDSGGIQEEAPSLNKPVLILRNVSERPEVVEIGAAKIIGSNYKNICNETSKLLNDHKSYNKMATAKNPFGNGNASELIVAKIEDFFKNKDT